MDMSASSSWSARWQSPESGCSKTGAADQRSRREVCRIPQQDRRARNCALERPEATAAAHRNRSEYAAEAGGALLQRCQQACPSKAICPSRKAG